MQNIHDMSVPWIFCQTPAPNPPPHPHIPAPWIQGLFLKAEE